MEYVLGEALMMPRGLHVCQGFRVARQPSYRWVTQDNRAWKGGMLGFGGIAAISTDSLFTRLAEVNGSAVTFWVGFLTAAVMLTAASRGFRRSPLPSQRNGIFPLVLAAALQAVSMTCFVFALKHTSVSNVVVIVAAAPLFAAAMAWLWLREITVMRVWLAMLCAAAGIVVVVGASIGGPQLFGDLLAVASVGCFAAGVVLLRKNLSLSASAVVGWGGVGMMLFGCGAAEVSGVSFRTWLALLAMGAVFGPLGRWMLALAPKYLASAQVALFAPLEMFFASLWAFLVFGEAPAYTTCLGGGIVILGVFWGLASPSIGKITATPRHTEVEN